MDSLDENSAHLIAADIAQDHRVLEMALRDVERALNRHDRARGLVEHQLRNLTELIEAHFAREEAGGYMGEALTRAPRLGGTAERLLAEHVDLLDDAQKLHMLARAGVESMAWWRQIEADFTHLKARLLAHEHAENKLLNEAFNRDIGVTD
jgi:hypothetical protein